MNNKCDRCWDLLVCSAPVASAFRKIQNKSTVSDRLASVVGTVHHNYSSQFVTQLIFRAEPLQTSWVPKAILASAF